MKKKIAFYRAVQILCDLFDWVAFAYIVILCCHMGMGYEAGWPVRYCLPRIVLLAVALFYVEPAFWNACEIEIEQEWWRAYNELVRSGLIPRDTRRREAARNESGKDCKGHNRNVG